MPRKYKPAQPANGLRLDAPDVIVQLNLAAAALQQAQAQMAPLVEHENALRQQISAFGHSAAGAALYARAGMALWSCEKVRSEALADRLDAAMAEVPMLPMPTTAYEDQLDAYEEAKALLATKTGIAKIVALVQMLGELANVHADEDADADAAAAAAVDRLYQFGSELRPEQWGNAQLHELWLQHLELREMQHDIDAAFHLHFPGHANPTTAEIDYAISQCELQAYVSLVEEHRQLSSTETAHVEALQWDLYATQSLLRDAELNVIDKTSALNAASAELQAFTLMSASPAPLATATAPGMLAAIAEEDELDLESSAETPTIGMVLVEHTPAWMAPQAMSEAWRDASSPTLPEVTGEAALATYLLLFPDAGLMGAAKSSDFSAALL